MTGTGSKPLTEAHIQKLRDDIADAVQQVSREWGFFAHPAHRAKIAERILDIPLLKALLVDNMADLPLERVGHLIRETRP